MSQVRLRLSPFQSQSRQCYLCWLSFPLHLHRVDIYKVTCILKSHHSVCALGALLALGRNFPFSGGSLSLPHVLRVVFIETYQTVTLATLAGGCLTSEMGAWAYSHQSVSGQTPRCPQSQTPISVFPRTALISVTFSEVGCSRCCCLTPGTTPPGSPRRWRLTRPRRLRLTRGDPRLGGRSAQGHVSRWRRQRPSGKTDGVRDSARSGCQRGPSPAAEGAPPPHAPGRGTMASSEEDGGGNGAVEEKENGKKKKKLGVLATTWLIFYNVAMTAGWLVLGIAMVRFYIQKGTHRGLFRSVQKTLKFFQTFALLEVIHCAVGIVRTSVLVTGVQVSSRIFMVWFIAHSIKQIQNEESVILFLVVWTVTEITRYSFYTFNLLNHLPYFIKWARYNFFIVLYPAGVAVFPQLYFHMLRQRRRVLHGEVIVEKDD
ncbi:very-long-chain (3R)-3-hydroxyacyl-CoA dehydratase 1 isoform 3-T3 [Geothlypis trichas]